MTYCGNGCGCMSPYSVCCSNGCGSCCPSGTYCCGYNSCCRYSYGWIRINENSDLQYGITETNEKKILHVIYLCMSQLPMYQFIVTTVCYLLIIVSKLHCIIFYCISKFRNVQKVFSLHLFWFLNIIKGNKRWKETYFTYTYTLSCTYNIVVNYIFQTYM